jgi:transposase
VTVYAYAQPVDMRKGVDGLRALVTEALHRDALNGDVYIFVSRDRVRAKVLHWDGTGLCIDAKRLARGCVARLWRDDGDAPIPLTGSELDLFLDGSTMVGRVALSPPPLTQFSRASDRPR